MYANLVLFRNELKNKKVSKYKLIGIITELIFSKEIFKKNSEISEFSESVLGIVLKDYILKSRTMVVAHVSKKIVGMEQFEGKDELLEFINKQILINNNKENSDK